MLHFSATGKEKHASCVDPMGFTCYKRLLMNSILIFKKWADVWNQSYPLCYSILLVNKIQLKIYICTLLKTSRVTEQQVLIKELILYSHPKHILYMQLNQFLKSHFILWVAKSCKYGRAVEDWFLNEGLLLSHSS